MAVEQDSGPLYLARLVSAGASEEESKVRRAPLEHDDAYELLDHEFTLEPDDPRDLEPTPVVDLPGRRWLPPLPKWAARSRALLERWAVRDAAREGASAERPSDSDVFYDDTPTPVMESVECSVTELRALRQELAWATRELYRREVQIDEMTHARVPQVDMLEGQISGQIHRISELEAALKAVGAARARDNARAVAQASELAGEVRGQAHRMAEVEAALRAQRAEARAAATGELVKRTRSAAKPKAKRARASVGDAKARPTATAAKSRGAVKAPKKTRAAPARKTSPKARKTAQRTKR